MCTMVALLTGYDMLWTAGYPIPLCKIGGEMAEEVMELSADAVRQVCDPGMFTFRTTDELQPLEEVVGQERAIRAATFGIGIANDGYHMFALGPAGTGKKTTMRKFLEREAAARPVPDDWLYVNNFASPDNPRVLCLPPGVGCKLRTDMDKLADELRAEVSRAFESPEYSKRQEQIGEEVQKQNQALWQGVDEFARPKGLDSSRRRRA